MFSRAQKFTHVCLRCQRRLARQTPEWSSPRTRVVDQQFNRLQSTAAARIEDDDDHHEPLPQEESSELIEPSSRQEKRYRFRKWRPTPSANLTGHDALGKPSEILILSQRDRDIPIVPTETEQEAKESLHDSITSEKAPLSWEQIKANINQTREQLGQQRGQLTLAQWTYLQSTLHEGFRNTQLRRYMNETWSRRPAESAALKLATKKRSQLVQLIATKVWGYELPEGVAVVVESAEKGGKSMPAKPLKLSFKVREAIIPSLQLRTQSLAQEFRVKIGLKDAKVSIDGVKDNVVQGSKAVRAFTKSLICTTIGGDPWLVQFGALPYSSIVKDLIESMRSRYRLHIQVEDPVDKKQQKLAVKVWHSRDDQEALLRIRHTLRMAVAPSARKSPSWLALSDAEVTGHRRLIRVPCHTNAALPADGVSQHHRLHLAAAAARKQSSTQKTIGSPESVLKAAKEAILAKLSTDAVEATANNARVEYSASFGQALFGYMPPERVAFAEYGKQPHAGYPIFTSEPVLVPQILSHPKFQDTARSSLTIPLDQKSHLFVRVRLSPDQLKSKWPSLEIFLRGSNPSAGLIQPLEVARVLAITEEKTFLIPLPNRAVDIQLARSIKREIFNAQDQSDGQPHPMLKAITEYVGDGKTAPSLFTTLPIPKSLFGTKPINNQKTAAGVVEEKFESVKYVQDSMEILDVDTRLAPPASGSPQRFTLEHITSQGGQLSPDRQELVLRHVPNLESLSSANADLELFFRSALDVADRIDGLGRQLRHRMEGLR